LDRHPGDVLHPISKGRLTEDIVHFMKLDSYVERASIQKIDFIKLDVDGYEYKVIQGATNAITRFKPIMVIEFGRYTLGECGDSLEGLVGLLTSLGYAFFSENDSLEYCNRESLLRAVPAERTINVLCKPRRNAAADDDCVPCVPHRSHHAPSR
jgi:hypothetical protein